MKRRLSVLLFSLAVPFLAACSSGGDSVIGPDDGGSPGNTSPTADLTHSPSSPSTGETVTVVDDDGSTDQATTTVDVSG